MAWTNLSPSFANLSFGLSICSSIARILSRTSRNKADLKSKRIACLVTRANEGTVCAVRIREWPPLDGGNCRIDPTPRRSAMHAREVIQPLGRVASLDKV